jgi:capsular polysaccharide biosynthesis protein
VDTPTLLALAWALSAPRPAACPSVQDSPSAVVDAAMPLFLRHGVLLI